MRDRRLDLAFPDRLGQLAETLLGETGAVFVTWLLRIFIDQIDGQLQRPAVPTGRLVQQAGQITDGIQSETRGFMRRSGRSSLFFSGHQAISILLNTRPRDRFWDIPVPKIDSAFDNLFVPQPSWSPSTTQQLRKLVAAPYLSPNDWTPRLDAYFASPLALCARGVSSAASRLLGSTSFRFALHGWQRMLSQDNIFAW